MILPTIQMNVYLLIQSCIQNCCRSEEVQYRLFIMTHLHLTVIYIIILKKINFNLTITKLNFKVDWTEYFQVFDKFCITPLSALTFPEGIL
jgi:hypothetical protein